MRLRLRYGNGSDAVRLRYGNGFDAVRFRCDTVPMRYVSDAVTVPIQYVRGTICYDRKVNIFYSTRDNAELAWVWAVSNIVLLGCCKASLQMLRALLSTFIWRILDVSKYIFQMSWATYFICSGSLSFLKFSHLTQKSMFSSLNSFLRNSLKKTLTSVKAGTKSWHWVVSILLAYREDLQAQRVFP